MNAYLQIGQFRYRGGGGRGNRPFRRGGRGHFNPRGRAPYRGRGRGRHFPSHSSGPGNCYVEIVPAAAEAPSVPQVSSLVSGNVSLPAPAQVPTAPVQPRKAWCEICKVECNTPEILEQHKNGKRHKKNVLVHEELQRRKSINGQQSGQMPTSQLNSTVQAEKLPESNSEGCPVENMGSEATDDNPKDETEVQNNIGETSEVSADKPEGNPRDGFASRGRGLKRKTRGGRGGKYMRPNDGSRRPVEPPKPKQPISFICELCNVKCESQVVYDSHLTGKKHQSSLKRVHGHQALSGEQGLQAIYPTDISAPSNSIDINALSNSINSQVQQGVNDPQVLLAQLLMTVLSQTQASAVAPPSGSVAAQISAPTPVAGSSHQSQFQSVSQTQVSETTAHGGKENPSGETKSELEAPKTAEGSSETEEVQKLPQNSSVPKPAGNERPSSECEAPIS